MEIRGIAGLSLYVKGPPSLRVLSLLRLLRLEAYKPLFLTSIAILATSTTTTTTIPRLLI